MVEWYIRIDGKVDKKKKFLGETADDALSLWREKNPALALKARTVSAERVTGGTTSTTARKPAKAAPMAGASLSDLIEAAKAHGESSEPEMEVGDLQEVLTTCWEVMTPVQRKAVFARHSELVQEWLV